MIFTDHLAIKDGAEDTSQMLEILSTGKLNVSPQNITVNKSIAWKPAWKPWFLEVF
jgi:hypothetical protein